MLLDASSLPWGQVRLLSSHVLLVAQRVTRVRRGVRRRQLRDVLQPAATDLHLLVLHGKRSEPILPGAQIGVVWLAHRVAKNLVQRRHARSQLRADVVRSCLHTGAPWRLARPTQPVGRLALRLVASFLKTLSH